MVLHIPRYGAASKGRQFHDNSELPGQRDRFDHISSQQSAGPGKAPVVSSRGDGTAIANSNSRDESGQVFNDRIRQLSVEDPEGGRRKRRPTDEAEGMPQLQRRRTTQALPNNQRLQHRSRHLRISDRPSE